MPDAPEDRLDALRRSLRAFVEERDWDRFHSPKDLAVGAAVEAGELLELFQWVDPAAPELASDARLAGRVRDEAADVYLFLLLLANKLGFDLVQAATEKLAANARKYPVEKARGSARKYTDLG